MARYKSFNSWDNRNNYTNSWEDRKRREDFQKFLTIIGIIILTIFAFCARNFIRDMNKFHMWNEGIASILILILTNIVLYSLCLPTDNYEIFGWGLLITFTIFCVYWHIVLHPKNEKYNAAIWQENQYWRQFDGWDFEKEVAKLFKACGYDATVTKGSGDGGVDIILTQNNRKTIVQCKHYQHPVSVEPIRALWGCMQDFYADEAIFIASSGFTSGCYDFIKDKPNYKFLTLEDLSHMAASLHGKLDDIYKQNSNDKSNKFAPTFISIYLLIGMIIMLLVYCTGNMPSSNTAAVYRNNPTYKSHTYNYPNCDADEVLKPLKQERTAQLKPLLENSQYVLNANYSLWYRNTTSYGNGRCGSDEMIKNLFWADKDVYLVHPIDYSTSYKNSTIVTEHDGYSGDLNTLINNSDFYRGNQKLSQSEIESLLENSLP